MPNFILAAIARLAAVAVAALAAFLAEQFGVQITAEDQALLSAGLTTLGGIFLLVIYALVRPIISRFIHPKDTSGPAPATQPEP